MAKHPRLSSKLAEILCDAAGALFNVTELHMSRGMPSMTALLERLAMAGYQNRDNWQRCSATRRLKQNPATEAHLEERLAILTECWAARGWWPAQRRNQGAVAKIQTEWFRVRWPFTD
jgi:hypothetical protein